MYVQVMRRHLSVQRPVKKLWLPARLEQLLLPDGRVDESMLLHMLPAGWLPARPGEMLLSIAHARGSSGLRYVKIFRPWERHFDCYVLELWHEEPR